MTDSTNSIIEYVRDEWTVGDILDLANEVQSWAPSAPVYLSAAQPKTRAGAIQAVLSE